MAAGGSVHISFTLVLGIELGRVHARHTPLSYMSSPRQSLCCDGPFQQASALPGPAGLETAVVSARLLLALSSHIRSPLSPLPQCSEGSRPFGLQCVLPLLTQCFMLTVAQCCGMCNGKFMLKLCFLSK